MFVFVNSFFEQMFAVLIHLSDASKFTKIEHPNVEIYSRGKTSSQVTPQIQKERKGNNK